MTEGWERGPVVSDVARYSIVEDAVAFDGRPIELSCPHHDEHLRLDVEGVPSALKVARGVDPRRFADPLGNGPQRRDLLDAVRFLAELWPWAEFRYELDRGTPARASTHVLVLSQGAEPPPDPPDWPETAANILLWVSRSDPTQPWRCHLVARRRNRDQKLAQRRRALRAGNDSAQLIRRR